MQFHDPLDWNQYIRTIAAGQTNVEISNRTGIGPSTISRWGRPKATDVIAFARAYGRPVTEALVAAGFITPTEASAFVSYSVVKAEEISNEQLAALVATRLGVNGHQRS